ncbi:MAG: leucine-rich repeat protein [Muribaculaceae bacterium]|nr:leucine-rich repeat protein [Muribaculaceae bacterium]
MKKSLLSIVLLLLSAAFTVSAVEFSSGDLMYSTDGTNATVTGLSTTGKGKSSLNLEIPSTITYSGTKYRVNAIAANAFKGQTNLTGVQFRWGVTVIGSSAFENCTNVTYVRLASSITNFGSSAFSGCSALKTVYEPSFTMPTVLQVSTWPANSGMTLYIPNDTQTSSATYQSNPYWNKFSTVTVGSQAWEIYFNDGGLYTVGKADSDGPNTVRELTLIGYNTNGSNTSNGTVYSPIADGTPSLSGISYKVTTVGTYAFYNQPTLKTVTIPSTVTSFKNSANLGNYCSEMTAINVASGNTNYSSYDGCLYNKAGTRIYRVPMGKTTISYNSALTTVSVNSHSSCEKLKSIRLPYGTRIIESWAFAYTAALDYVYIPSSVTTLANNAFVGTRKNIFVYCNMATPPTITHTTMFGSNVTTTSGSVLFVPYGKINTYKSAGWTGFQDYNIGSCQAHYIYTDNVGYTVTSTATTTVNGSSYGGRVKVVSYGAPNSGNTLTTINIPASITYNGKTYAVTMIGEDAFNNHTDNFTVTGCANVDTIGSYAFQNQSITSYPFTHTLKVIGHRAFEGSGFTGTVQIPFGVKHIGICAFANGKYSRIVVPQGVGHFGDMWINTSTLTEIVYNMQDPFYTGWDLTGVPSTCYLRVPTGMIKEYKANSKLSSRANYITAGAYDFAYYNNHDGGHYFLTITSTTPTTHNGTTYAGRAKYVYHPNIQNTTNTGTGTYVFGTSEEDRTVSGDYRRYLITEIGDSLLYKSKFTSGTIPPTVTRIGHSAFESSAYAVNNLTLPSGLTSIGYDAFYDSKITGELKVPSSVTTLEDYALCAPALTSIYFPDMVKPAMGYRVWSQTVGTVWVPNNRASSYLTTASSWGGTYADKLAPWIKPVNTSEMFSSVLPTNLAGSDINAYYASGYDKSQTTKQVTLTKANQSPANTGLLLTDLTAGAEYRISRPSGSVSSPMTNYFIGNPDANVNVYTQNVGFYWDADNKKFVKPTLPYTLSTGQAYLKLSSSEASGLTEVYTNLWPNSGNYKTGDVNGDGEVDVNDVNILINIVLGKDNAGNYGGRANVDGIGDVDVADVNTLINLVLGK